MDGEIGGGALAIIGMKGQIDPDPYGQPEPASRMGAAFQQYARCLTPADQKIIGPFQLHQRRIDHAGGEITHSQSCGEGELGGTGRAGFQPVKPGAEQIARCAGPGPSAPAAPGGLDARHDPDRPRLSGERAALGLLVGGIQLVENLDAQTRAARAYEDTLIAVASTMPATGTSATVASAAARLMKATPAGAGSNTPTGSSNQITFTTRR